MLDRSSWIVRPWQRSAASFPLICFPYAGAGPSVFRGLGQELASRGVEAWVAQLPGREGRFWETPIQSIQEAAAAIAAAAVRSLNGPFAFYGYSVGAKVAFETAREIRRLGGAEPALLFVSASFAPQIPWPYPSMRDLSNEYLIQEVQRRYGGIPEIVLREPELLRLLLPALRADIAMLETYQYSPEPALGCAITAFGGSDDPTINEFSLAAWKEQTRSAFRLRMFPGGHFFWNDIRPALADMISAAVAGVGAQLSIAGPN
jgi:medium-chain acyl-[acyl-carrier-protein] hydrolase